MSVGLNHATDISEYVVIGDGQENDMIQWRKFQFPQGSIVVFDKGYIDYQWFRGLADQGFFL